MYIFCKPHMICLNLHVESGYLCYILWCDNSAHGQLVGVRKNVLMFHERKSQLLHIIRRQYCINAFYGGHKHSWKQPNDFDICSTFSRFVLLQSEGVTYWKWIHWKIKNKIMTFGCRPTWIYLTPQLLSWETTNTIKHNNTLTYLFFLNSLP